MSTFPRYRLYESDGTTLVYDFENVLDDKGIFEDPTNFIEHVALRGQGAINIEGSTSPFDITLNFVLFGTDYEDLVAKMLSVKSTIDQNTKYILKVQLTTGGSTEDFKVKRLTSIQWPNSRNSKRVRIQDGTITLRVNTWQ